MDMVLVQKRTVDDKILWLTERDRFEEALKIAEESTYSLKTNSVEKIAKQYYDHLLEEEDYGEAARYS